jgi:hypothetical protein
VGGELAEWIVTSPDGQELAVQLAYFDRDRDPVAMDVGPVLDLQEVAGGQGLRASQPGRATRLRRHCCDAGPVEPGRPDQLRPEPGPGPDRRDFADAGRQLDQISDRAFARYGLTPADIAVLRDRFTAWPRLAGLADARSPAAEPPERTPSDRHAEPGREPERGR